MPRGAASHDVLCQSPRTRSPCNETSSDPAPPAYVALVPTVFAATWDGLPMLPRVSDCALIGGIVLALPQTATLDSGLPPFVLEMR
ncbi:hypothetical protein VTO73DRAFT_2654 [Trametes versicolor]